AFSPCHRSSLSSSYAVPRHLLFSPTRRSSDLGLTVLRHAERLSPPHRSHRGWRAERRGRTIPFEARPLLRFTGTGTVGSHQPIKIGRAQSELQSRENLVCRLLLEKKNKTQYHR